MVFVSSTYIQKVAYILYTSHLIIVVYRVLVKHGEITILIKVS